MANMTYLEGREAIQIMLDNYPNTKHRQGVIDQVLWSVAHGEGVELANALIWNFDLFMYDRGSHNFFACDKTGWDYHHNRFPTNVSCYDDYRHPKDTDNKEIEELIKAL